MHNLTRASEYLQPALVGSVIPLLTSYSFLPLLKLGTPILQQSACLMKVPWLQGTHSLAALLDPHHISARWLGYVIMAHCKEKGS